MDEDDIGRELYPYVGARESEDDEDTVLSSARAPAPTLVPVEFAINDRTARPHMVVFRGDNARAVTDGVNVLDRNLSWVYEPLPSNRTDEFIAATRFSSPEEALEAYKRSRRET